MLQLGFMLSNSANNRLHKPTDPKFYAFMDGDKDLFQMTRKDMVGGQFDLLGCTVVAGKSFIRISTNLYKSNVVKKTSQLYLYLMCQLLPAWLQMHWNLATEKSADSYPDRNQLVAFKTESCPIFTTGDQILKLKISLQPA